MLFSWVNQLFRLGHFPVRYVAVYQRVPSLDWFKGKFTGQTYVYLMVKTIVSCRFSQFPRVSKGFPVSIPTSSSSSAFRLFRLFRLRGASPLRL
jgi:hypothetical protein